MTKSEGLSEAVITKKVAAVEVYKLRKRSTIIALTGIGGVLVVAIAGIFSRIGGAIAAGCIAAGLAYVIFTDRQVMIYLNDEYRLNRENEPIK